MTAAAQSRLRDSFPALTSRFAFFENAGGSQVPRHVIERVNDLYENGYVQTGAEYPAADYVDDVVAKAKAFANVMMNGEGGGTTLLGPSTTALLHRLSDCLAHQIVNGDEIVVSVANHEANIGPWLKLERLGAKIVWWGIDRESAQVDIDELERLVTDKTRIVACAHTSNLLGDILDVQRVVRIAHNVGAKVVVDGVAYAPHQTIDVQEWDVDFYVFSFYKVYGPHIAALYGKKEQWAVLKGPNHYFIPDDAFPWKFELGCQPYELLAGILGVADYFAEVAGTKSHERGSVIRAFKAFRELELRAQRRIQSYLTSRSDIRVLGVTDSDERHPTLSFVHSTLASDEVARRTNTHGVGIRFGHMYAKRLCEALGIAPEPGVVRVSAVHYNDATDVETLIAALDQALAV